MGSGRRGSQVVEPLFQLPQLMPAVGDRGVTDQEGAVSVDAQVKVSSTFPS